MRIEFDDDIHYKNPLGGDKQLHWSVRFELFAVHRETEPGERVKVGCAHNSNEIVIWDASAS